jgi:putative FmdB family regulatory protein
MPTYDYVCDKCGYEFELFQKMSDMARKRCPRCRGAIRRRIGAGSGLLFKGSGFYATDYRSADYKTKAKADTGGANAASSEGKASGGSDSAAKPAKDTSGPGKKS